MVDKSLEIFITTADCGSFSRAAEQLFITHTAVIKQLNHLEDRIGVRLLERSHHGVKLTPAGEAFYREAAELMRLSREAVKRVRSVGGPEQKTLRVGTSALCPCQDFFEFWQQKEEGESRFRFQIVPFSDDSRRYEHLGRDFDFLVGPYNNLPARDRCRFLPIGRYQFSLLMGREHPLAKKKSLKFRDLQGETVMVMEPGTSPVNDSIRADLAAECPGAFLADIPPTYNMDTFNRCAESGALLLSLECWKQVHPALTAVTLDEDFSMEYGVIAARSLEGDMKLFWETLKEKV